MSFVTEIDPSASGAGSLVYSTFLGGSGENVDGAGDEASAIALDGSGDVVVAGSATSADFPVTGNAFQTAFTLPYDCIHSYGLYCAATFVSVISPGAPPSQQLKYSTYVGALVGESWAFFQRPPAAVAVDGSGRLYVAGETISADFPTTPGAFQTTCPDTYDTDFCDAGFVAVLDPSMPPASQLRYGTFLGGSNVFTDGDGAGITAMAVDSSGRLYLTGYSYLYDFPVTPDAAQSTCPGCWLPGAPYSGGSNAFFTVLDPSLSGSAALVYSTFLGGSNRDRATGIAIDSLGHVAIVGFTSSRDYPVSANALEPRCRACGNFVQTGLLARISHG